MGWRKESEKQGLLRAEAVPNQVQSAPNHGPNRAKSVPASTNTVRKPSASRGGVKRVVKELGAEGPSFSI